MKRIIYGVLSFFLVASFTVFGSTQQDETYARIDDIHLENQQLHCELQQLRSQLHRIEQRSCRSKRWSCNYWPKNFFWGAPYGPLNKSGKDCENIGNNSTETGFTENGYSLKDYARMWGTPQNLFLLAAVGATVTTSPFLGLRSAFDASDLIVNLPTMNEDLRFLKEHVQLQKKLDCYGVRLPDRPIIELGGKIEGIVFAQEGWDQDPTRGDIDIGSARLDVLVEVSHAVHAFMALNMDSSAFDLLNNSSLDIQLAGSGSRIFNSRVYVSRAFVTIGDLNCSPLYFTIGQMFVPFGRYASNMVTSTLTVELARTNERALLLGLYKNGFYGSIYAFRGESNVGAPGIDQGGINVGFEKTFDKGSLNLGAGYILNIADATGMQITGASRGFFGFGLNGSTEFLEHRVPAYDVHGEFALGKFSLFAEYIWTTTAFAVNNLSFNYHGAQPSASNVELGYNFKFADCPASLAVGYGTSSQALALAIPKNSLLAAFNISIWKNTIESLEYRHDTNYPGSDTAGGNGAIPAIVNSIGGSRNTFTAQIGVYF